ENGNFLSFEVQVEGEVTVDPTEAVLDAADLPKVANAATSVANNQSIESDVPIYLHDAQFAAGGFNPTSGGGEVGTTCIDGGCPAALGLLIGAYGVTELVGQLGEIIEHTSISGLMSVAAVTGFIQPTEITA